MGDNISVVTTRGHDGAIETDFIKLVLILRRIGNGENGIGRD